MSAYPLRVFVSYTAEDLSAHADVVVGAIQGLNMMPVDHRTWSATGRPSVAECKRQIESCQILVVLVAHRFGWIPRADEGGNGEYSITQIEVHHAKASGLRVLPFLVRKDAEWKADQIEGYGNLEIKSRLDRFKAELQETLAGFFASPVSLDGPASRALQAAADEIARTTESAQEKAEEEPEENELILPWTAEKKTPVSLPQRLGSQLPKRILAIDDSETAGACLGLLQRIQDILRIRYGTEDFFLSDYYDLIVGIGRSSFMAALLALRTDVLDLQDRFVAFSKAAVAKRAPWIKRFRYFYSDDLLVKFLPKVFGETMLGSSQLETGLLLISTRLETYEPFAFTNHPAWSGYQTWRNLPLADLVLGCSSLPIYLPIRRLTAPLDRDDGLFVDGTLSIGNNPSLYGLLAVTSDHFPFHWRLGRNWLSLTSVGGKFSMDRQNIHHLEGTNVVTLLTSIPTYMIHGASTQGKMMLEALGLSSAKDTDPAQVSKFTALTYQRYELSDQALSPVPANTDDPFVTRDIADIPGKLPGQIAATRLPARAVVEPSHFRKPFDVRRPAGGA